ncbi:hypothetical protein GCM10027053_18440 [Intrasporangium mesophilum]
MPTSLLPRPRRRGLARLLLAGLAASAATLPCMGGLAAATAAASPLSSEHCISPTGVDLNVTYHIHGRIVSRFCTEAFAGERFSPASGWFMSPTWTIAPAGFTPVAPTPPEDFVARLEGVQYVVDAGTAQQRTVFFPDGPQLGIVDAGGLVVANAVTLGRIGPLSAGAHTLDTYPILNGPTCDGLGDSTVDNCLPGGTTWFDSYDVTVLPQSR